MADCWAENMAVRSVILKAGQMAAKMAGKRAGLMAVNSDVLMVD